MAIYNETQLNQSIKAGEIHNAYLIYGEENYLKQHYVNKLRSKLVDKTFESFNLHYFEGKDIDIDDVIKDAQMLPMMSEYSLVIVKDYPSDKLQSGMKSIKEYFEDINDACVLVFWFDSVDPDEKSARFKNLLKLFDKAGVCAELKKRSESEVVRMLCSGAKKRGSSLDINTARYLIEVVGNDMKSLLNELDKLSFYAGGSEITAEIVDLMATKSLEARIYDLSTNIFSKNIDKAFSIINNLFAVKEEAADIIRAISSSYIDMYRVKCAKSANLLYTDVGNYFNYNRREFVLKYASRDCANFTEAQLRRSLDAIAEVELKLKSTSIDEKTMLEELIIKLVLIAKE